MADRLLRASLAHQGFLSFSVRDGHESLEPQERSGQVFSLYEDAGSNGTRRTRVPQALPFSFVPCHSIAMVSSTSNLPENVSN